jgi:hypothetical protein
MTRTLLAILITAIAGTTVLWGQDARHSCAMSNGRYWQGLEQLDHVNLGNLPVIRGAYISALVDEAMTLTADSETANPNPSAISLLAFNVVLNNGKIAGFLDFFYKDSANLPIPIPWALGIIEMQANRTPDYPKIEAQILAARRAATGDCHLPPRQ